VNRPKVLLLDEPLAALDLQLRQRSDGTARPPATHGADLLLVTHDQEEALGVSDRLAVMRCQPNRTDRDREELYARPRNRFVAVPRHLQPAAGAGSRTRGNDQWMDTEVGGFRLPTSSLPAFPVAGARLLLGFRPENVEIGPDDGGPRENGSAPGSGSGSVGERRNWPGGRVGPGARVS
jgi:ABC-type Fe3+/spermidine/putrescine transport system ATPase subunit